MAAMSSAAPKWTNPDAEPLLREASKLPVDDRRRFADELLATVPDDEQLSPAWKEEILQRAEAFERGDLKTVDGREVMARLRAKYAR